MHKLYLYLSRQVESLLSFFPAYARFLSQMVQFSRMNQRDERFQVDFFSQYPCLSDATSDTPFEPHYLYHPAWAARVLQQIRPKKHVDISSTLTFCSIVSAFIPVDFYDYRPANLKLSGLSSKHADLMALPFRSNSIESISCMHTIEHIGLGRYGDPLDPIGDQKAIAELIRVTKKGGSILFVTPVGRRQLRFNAHRVYAYADILKSFTNCTLKDFSLVPDNVFEVGLLHSPSKQLINRQEWGCGCFWFVKD